jgi:hypothetical protein
MSSMPQKQPPASTAVSSVVWQPGWSPAPGDVQLLTAATAAPAAAGALKMAAYSA